MKLVKDFSRVALVVTLACSFALTSCKKDEEDAAPTCTEIKARLEAAQNDEDESVAACEEFLAAAQAGIDSDCYTDEEKAELQLAVSLIQGFGGCQ
ncbi:hypothetical protein WAF17_09040 [Bernardetia sp. ABR2-2B]|uniref:hypothetical protein n=1 Tax=Bernardetia sp. ABR2-2B TaxID=3127472 RepID=UPI0030CEE52E